MENKEIWRDVPGYEGHYMGYFKNEIEASNAYQNKLATLNKNG